jgi:nucleotide-binding universal stress UspA family protein
MLAENPATNTNKDPIPATHMSERTIRTILAPVDFSDITPWVVEMAATLARAFQCRIVLLHVVEPEPEFVGFEPGPMSVRTAVAGEFRDEHHQLDQLKTELANTGLAVSALQIQGPTAEKILHESEAQRADLIVIGSHGHGSLYNLLVGSVATGVLKSARCPVVIVPNAKTENR